MFSFKTLTLTLVILLLTGGSAFASTFTFGDSEYTIVQSNGINWNDARLAAEADGGHLVTITSVAENNFLKNTVFQGQDKAYWLGAYQTDDANRQNPTSNWHWVTGEDWNFTDWYTSEPNNQRIDEMHLSADQRFNYQWNDEGSAISSMINGYVVEKPTAPTPIPGAIWLLGASLAALFGIKKKFGNNSK
ncbi:lectin-like protein [Desulfovibrio sp. JC022]|uniref:lectin-like protein n=1 Tax=Desulfovibrio sp. JC022 TaxID=2593642 RepID=UPI0013D1E2D4|nr:lectin-like protein [Desulfovibrio sp. JC022]NDV24661.1 lectin [Desulfovibrio sp. JC022]